MKQLIARCAARPGQMRAAGEVPAGDARLVYLDLYHSHAPKLAEADAVEYDRESGLVEATDDGCVTSHPGVGE